MMESFISLFLYKFQDTQDALHKLKLDNTTGIRPSGFCSIQSLGSELPSKVAIPSSSGSVELVASRSGCKLMDVQAI